MEKRRVPMSKPVAPPDLGLRRGPTRAEPPSYPGVLDFVCIFAGVILSALLTSMSGLGVTLSAAAQAESAVQLVQPHLPFVLFLPVGVVLFWPFFHVTQWVVGRRQGLSFAEWLLAVNWLVFAALCTWIVLKWTNKLQDWMNYPQHVLWGYIAFMMACAALTPVFLLTELLGRGRRPWTQSLTVVLTFPALALAIVWSLGGKFTFDLALGLGLPQIFQ